MIETIAYGSCYVYSPKGTGAVCERSRILLALLKAGDAGLMIKYARRVRQQAEDSPALAGFFVAGAVLVPVPGSAPGGAWAAERLTAALLEAGIGRAAWSGLRRLRAVRKSATAAPGCRPTVSSHYDSFGVDRPCGATEETAPDTIVLIDDVVTKGRTLLAAANRVHEAFPHSNIRAFALLRTMGLTATVRRILDPCTGEIRWRSGDAHRSP